MKHLALIAELEQLADQLNLRVRYEIGDFDGGFCILKDERMLVINKKLTHARRAAVLAQALAEVGLDALYIKPSLRQYIEDEIAKGTKVK